MKLISKINRGFILIIIAIVSISIYLFNLSGYQNAQKPKIQEVCTEYIDKAVSYQMLPTKYIKEKSMPEKELNSYIDDLNKDMKSFYIENEQAYKYIIEIYEENLEEQAKGIGIVYSFTKNIVEFKKFKFEDDLVTVTINTNSSYDGPNMESEINSSLNGEAPRKLVSSKTEDTITLQKIGDEWKLVNCNITLPSENPNATMEF